MVNAAGIPKATVPENDQKVLNVSEVFSTK